MIEVPSPSLIARLEKLLAAARSGEIVAFAYVASGAEFGGDYRRGFLNVGSLGVIGALELLRRDIVEEQIRSEREP